MQATTFTERCAERARNAEKSTEWRIDICGARSVGGRKHVCDSQTKSEAVCGVRRIEIFIAYAFIAQSRRSGVSKF